MYPIVNYMRKCYRKEWIPTYKQYLLHQMQLAQLILKVQQLPDWLLEKHCNYETH